MERGDVSRLGAVADSDGTRFALYTGSAEEVELCLFDAEHRQTQRLALTHCDDGVWHGFLPGIEAGQRYGYRVHGPYEPENGLWCNPAKLLVDPYARELSGELKWSQALFAYDAADPQRGANRLDSSPYVPLSRVSSRDPARHVSQKPDIPWSETIFYEANVRGLTMKHPDLSQAERGTLRGLRNAALLEYLRALGITSLELMPVQAFIDDHFLYRRGLRNFWGYNTLSFFAPAARYLGDEPASAFRQTVDAIHDHGMEVILDVAYNHTAETDHNGPTLSFRGIDNHCYYRTQADDPGRYVNDTGCGNTVNMDHPRSRQLIVDSLRYWATDMGVDGFRFDLASVLGRESTGFRPDHPLLRAISDDPVLGKCKLIAEPWDPGPGGYQLGQFPAGWSEWNDRYRDALRRFWRGDRGLAPELARRMHGSADLFEHDGRGPRASVNFITSHDGYTLQDLVSYEQRHNHANGENNRDGHSHNFSDNLGIEGPSNDDQINARRRRRRLNLLASMLFSQGTPMLLAGDEFGNSQQGNNNAYAQDNDIGWLDWSGLEADPAFTEQVRTLIQLRRAWPMLRQQQYLHGEPVNGIANIHWLNEQGEAMQSADWHHGRALALMLADPRHRLAVVLNADTSTKTIKLPAGNWTVQFSSADELAVADADGHLSLPGECLILCQSER